jgi:hypothetical protein
VWLLGGGGDQLSRAQAADAGPLWPPRPRTDRDPRPLPPDRCYTAPQTGQVVDALPPRQPGQLWPPPLVSLTMDAPALAARYTLAFDPENDAEALRALASAAPLGAFGDRVIPVRRGIRIHSQNTHACIRAIPPPPSPARPLDQTCFF